MLAKLSFYCSEFLLVLRNISAYQFSLGSHSTFEVVISPNRLGLSICQVVPLPLRLLTIVEEYFCPPSYLLTLICSQAELVFLPAKLSLCGLYFLANVERYIVLPAKLSLCPSDVAQRFVSSCFACQVASSKSLHQAKLLPSFLLGIFRQFPPRPHSPYYQGISPHASPLSSAAIYPSLPLHPFSSLFEQLAQISVGREW